MLLQQDLQTLCLHKLWRHAKTYRNGCITLLTAFLQFSHPQYVPSKPRQACYPANMLPCCNADVAMNPVWMPCAFGGLLGILFAGLNRFGMRRFWRAPQAPLNVVITGGSRGLGKALAREFLRYACRHADQLLCRADTRAACACMHVDVFPHDRRGNSGVCCTCMGPNRCRPCLYCILEMHVSAALKCIGSLSVAQPLACMQSGRPCGAFSPLGCWRAQSGCRASRRGTRL